MVHEYHPISLRSFIETNGSLPFFLAKNLFASIIRATFACQILKMDLTELHPGVIFLNGNFVPKLGFPEFLE